MKKIEDYLYLYVGHKCVTPIGIMTLSYFNQKSRYKAWFTDDHEENRGHLYENNVTGHAFLLTEFKPILRKMSSMTEEEKKELEATKALQRPSPVHPLAMMVWTAETYRLALSKGFDLFNLIDENLALDSSTLVG